MRSFLAAVAFLTILPVPTKQLTALHFARASGWFSSVGLLIGVLLLVGDWLLRLILPESIAAVLLLALWVGVTGALHWDGLLDCFDALLAPVSPERRLIILKDVHVGAFAVVGAGLTLLLYTVLLLELPEGRRGWALLLSPVMGRWTLTYLQARWPYKRDVGLGSYVAAPPPCAVLLSVWPLALGLLSGLRFVATFLFTLLLIHLLASWMVRRLDGGLTGDCYGALCEVAQLLVLLGYVLG